MITLEDSLILKKGIVNIHKMIELRKLHMRQIENGTTCATCVSFCKDQNKQKENRDFIHKYRQ